MKKILLSIFLVVIISGMVICGYATELRLAGETRFEKDNFIEGPGRYLGNVISQATNGEYTLTLHGGGVLGASKDIAEQVMDGLLEFGTMPESAVAYFYPNFQIFSIPYLFRTEDIAYDVLDGPFGDKMRQEVLEKTGMRIIAWGDNGGFRNFSTSNKPIKSPADLKGLKIRTMEIPAHMEMVKSLGASPVPVAWPELYTALQTGVADGQENAIPTILMGNLEEVQKYIILDKHLYSMQIFVVSEDWFQKQDRELQLAILSAGRVMNAMIRGIARLAELNGIDYINEKGGEVYLPNAEEYSQFRDLTQEPVIEWCRNQPNIDNNIIDELLEAVKESEKKFGYE